MMSRIECVFVSIFFLTVCFAFPSLGNSQDFAHSANLGVFNTTADWGLEPFFKSGPGPLLFSGTAEKCGAGGYGSGG